MKQITVDEQEVTPSDSTLTTLWASSYINSFLVQGQRTDEANQIVFHSVNERILTPYTAFLVLEPGFVPDINSEPDFNIKIPFDDGDWWGWIEAVESLDYISDLTIYPNPVSDVATINITLSEAVEVRVELIDINGRTICLLLDEYLAAGQNKTDFEVGNLLPGMYICRISLGGKVVRHEKVMVM